MIVKIETKTHFYYFWKIQNSPSKNTRIIQFLLNLNFRETRSSIISPTQLRNVILKKFSEIIIPITKAATEIHCADKYFRSNFAISPPNKRVNYWLIHFARLSRVELSALRFARIRERIMQECKASNARLSLYETIGGRIGLHQAGSNASECERNARGAQPAAETKRGGITGRRDEDRDRQHFQPLSTREIHPRASAWSFMFDRPVAESRCVHRASNIRLISLASDYMSNIVGEINWRN